MLDEYWFGEVTRISPEAPVPVISVQRIEKREGAAANVANNVEAMGVEVRRVFGSGERIRKLRVVSKKQQMLRIDFDFPQEPITRLDLSGIDVVVFVDYGKGSLANVQSLIAQCRKEGKTVLVDPKGYDYERYRGADLVKPNLDEMRVMVGGWKDEQDLANKVEAIKEKADIRAILLTRASEGMTLYEDWSVRIYAEPRELVDVSGAGETAIAAFAVAVHDGHDFYQAAKYANKAAGVAVSRFGTAVVGRDEVFEALGTCQEG
jgi:rfaE bifunctional protein kinase chain/domain